VSAPKPFLTDIKTLRERARKHMEDGAVTQGYTADRETVIKLLNEALATEIVCVLRYRRHADSIAHRIVQLKGEPDFNPQGLLSRSHAEYVEGENLTDMIREDLVAERIAIDSYREMIAYFGNDDPTSRRLMEEILAVEEEHADDLVNLLDKMN
jgi:bacterioferritin